MAAAEWLLRGLAEGLPQGLGCRLTQWCEASYYKSVQSSSFHFMSPHAAVEPTQGVRGRAGAQLTSLWLQSPTLLFPCYNSLPLAIPTWHRADAGPAAPGGRWPPLSFGGMTPAAQSRLICLLCPWQASVIGPLLRARVCPQKSWRSSRYPRKPGAWRPPGKELAGRQGLRETSCWTTCAAASCPGTRASFRQCRPSSPQVLPPGGWAAGGVVSAAKRPNGLLSCGLGKKVVLPWGTASLHPGTLPSLPSHVRTARTERTPAEPVLSMLSVLGVWAHWISGALRVGPFFQNPILCLCTHLKASFLKETLLIPRPHPDPGKRTVWNFPSNGGSLSDLGVKGRRTCECTEQLPVGIRRGSEMTGMASQLWRSSGPRGCRERQLPGPL